MQKHIHLALFVLIATVPLIFAPAAFSQTGSGATAPISPSAKSLVAPFLDEPTSQNSTNTIAANSAKINEVALDSPNGTRWVELFNPQPTSLDLTNYTLITDNTTITISPMSAIAAHGFYLLQIPKGNFSSADMLVLKNSSGIAVSRTPLLIDTFADTRTWQALPDGSDQWRFENQTAMRPNDPATYYNSTKTITNAQDDTNTAACTGSAGCAVGTVIRISSPSTMYVQLNNTVYKIRLALVNSNGNNQSTAIALADNYCLGNNALVNQDDRDPVLGDSIIATVWCSNANLSELLLQGGLASLDHDQCKTSEFASTAWAKAAGC